MILKEQFHFKTSAPRTPVYLATYNVERDVYVISWDKSPPFHKEAGSTVFQVKTVKAALRDKDWIMQNYNTNQDALTLMEGHDI